MYAAIAPIAMTILKTKNNYFTATQIHNMITTTKITLIDSHACRTQIIIIDRILYKN